MRSLAIHAESNWNGALGRGELYGMLPLASSIFQIVSNNAIPNKVSTDSGMTNGTRSQKPGKNVLARAHGPSWVSIVCDGLEARHLSNLTRRCKYISGWSAHHICSLDVGVVLIGLSLSFAKQQLLPHRPCYVHMCIAYAKGEYPSLCWKCTFSSKKTRLRSDF